MQSSDNTEAGGKNESENFSPSEFATFTKRLLEFNKLVFLESRELCVCLLSTTFRKDSLYFCTSCEARREMRKFK